MPLIKIWNFDRTIKKLAIAKNLEELKLIAKQKLNYNENIPVKVLFESDGTEIEEEEEFQYLLGDISQIILQVIPESENWVPPTKENPNLDLASIPSTPVAPITVSESAFTMQPSGSMHSFQTAGHSGIEIHDLVEGVSGFLDVSSTFEIPWEYFSQRFINDCEAQKIPNPADRREVIRQIVNKIREINKNPPRKFIQKVAIDMTNKYPILSDSVGPQKCATLFTQIENRIRHCNRLVKHDKRKIKFPSETSKAIAVKSGDKHGCRQWQPLEYPEGESATSQNEKKEWLKLQYKLSIDNDDISNKMALTYPSQRMSINDKSFNLINFCEEWPYMFQKKYFLQHANALMKFNIEEKWRQQLSVTIPKLIQLFRSDTVKKYLKTKYLMEAIDNINEEAESKVAEECSLLQSLLNHFSEDEDLIIKYFEKTDSLEDVCNSLKESSYPVIAVFGNNVLENPQAAVCIHGKSIGNIENFKEQVIIAFIAYYVFNYKYPGKLEATLEFIQRCILNIEPVEGGHKRGGKRKRTTVHPSVLKLANMLRSQESIYGISTDD